MDVNKEESVGSKRKAEDDCCTVRGKVSKSQAVQRPTLSSNSLLRRLSHGEKVDLDALDGIDNIPQNRVRSSSECDPSHGFFNFSNRSSLPSTPSIPAPIRRRHFSTSDVAITRHRSLLGNFTESALNGRLEAFKIMYGFSLQVTSTGASFCSTHLTLPVTVHFFDLNTPACSFFPSTPVPFLGKCEIGEYRIPNKGTLQVTLFNPQKTVVKVFLTNYNVEDMPPNSKTFIRHIWQWEGSNKQNTEISKSLENLIHYRLSSDRRRCIHLHTDIRILFSQDSSRDALLLPQANESMGIKYQLKDHVEIPKYTK